MTSDIYTSLFEMSCYFFIEIIYILAENMYLFNEFIWKTFESFSTTELQTQQILYLLRRITLICINNRSLLNFHKVDSNNWKEHAKYKNKVK
jgi:hypothetical protein